MWRIKSEKSERGAVAPLTAILLVVLLGMTALAVDVGMMYSEHAQLQNGADSSALAIAQACAATTPAAACGSPLVSAAPFANGNALDGTTKVDSATVGDHTVDVTTKSRDVAGNEHLSLVFARVLGFDTTEIRASAQAMWGPPGSGGAFPLALSDKCWDLSESASTGVMQKISWKPGTTCTNPSGHTIPGGWGWLDDPDNDCHAVTTTGNVVGSNPGNDKPQQCETVLQGWIDALSSGDDVKVLFPVFDSASGPGNTGSFHIIGYATFNIVGWKFGNNGVYEYHNTTAALGNSKLACASGKDRCIVGQFVKYQTLESIGSSGSGIDLGTISIRLTK